MPADPEAPFFAIAPPGGVPAAGITVERHGRGARPSRCVDPDDPLSRASTCPRSPSPSPSALDARHGERPGRRRTTSRCCVRGAVGGIALRLPRVRARRHEPAGAGRLPAPRRPAPHRASPAPPCRRPTSSSATRLPVDRRRRRHRRPRRAGRRPRSSPGAPGADADRPGFWTDRAAAGAARPRRRRQRRPRRVRHRAGGRAAHARRQTAAGRGRRAPAATACRRWVAVAAARRARRRVVVRPAPARRRPAASGGPPSRCGSASPRCSSPPCSTRPSLRPADRVATVFLLDGSASLGAAGRAEAVDVGAATRSTPARRRRGRRRRASAATPGSSSRSQPDAAPRPAGGHASTPTAPNLAGALRLAAGVLPADARRRIVVVSDGRATEGDAAAEATRLAEAGHRRRRHHVVGRAAGADLAVAAVDVPGARPRGRRRSTSSSPSTPTAPGPVAAHAAPRRRRRRRAGRRASPPADTQVAIPQIAGGERASARYQRARRRPAATPSPRTTSASPPSGRGRRPRCSSPRAARRGRRPRRRRCAPAASAVDVVDAPALPALDRLAGYPAIVLVDVDARTLTGDQVAALAAVDPRPRPRPRHRRRRPQPTALGGYLGTPLEELLPVDQRDHRPAAAPDGGRGARHRPAGSMGACHCAEGQGMGSRLPRAASRRPTSPGPRPSGPSRRCRRSTRSACWPSTPSTSG